MPIEILSSLSLYFEVLTLQIQCIRNWSRSSELSGRVPPGIRRTDKLSLWRGRTLERGGRRAARGWNTRNMGRAFLSAPKPRWRSGPVRFTGLLERRAGKAPSGEMNFYASRSTPVVGEVRPVNRAVRYLIRAR